MESRIRIFLLITVFALPGMPVLAAEKAEQQPAATGENPVGEVIQQDPVIQPEVKRREVKQADIETENFEIGVFAGFLICPG